MMKAWGKKWRKSATHLLMGEKWRRLCERQIFEPFQPLRSAVQIPTGGPHITAEVAEGRGHRRRDLQEPVAAAADEVAAQ